MTQGDRVEVKRPMEERIGRFAISKFTMDGAGEVVIYARFLKLRPPYSLRLYISGNVVLINGNSFVGRFSNHTWEFSW